MNSFCNKFFGDKNFYKTVLKIALPIIIQNGITNFVSLLDNIMIGKLGTEPMSGASIVNQLVFIYYLCIFGAVSGAGIFTAQYYGKGDYEGVKHTFRYKLWLGLILCIATILVFIYAQTPLINAYLKSEPDVKNAELALKYGQQYITIILFSLPAFFITQTYASTLRECGKTLLPMIAAAISVFTNLALNYVLIYGKLGLPALGVEGAAIATVISQAVSFTILLMMFLLKKSIIKLSIKETSHKIKIYGEIVKVGFPSLCRQGLASIATILLNNAAKNYGNESTIAAIGVTNKVVMIIFSMCLGIGQGYQPVCGYNYFAKKYDRVKEEIIFTFIFRFV